MKVLVSVLFCLCSLFSFSQEYVNLATAFYSNTPNNSFENSKAQTQIEELSLDITLPIPLNENTALLTGLFANTTNLKLDPEQSTTDLKVIGLGLGLNHVYNKKWSATYMLIPKLASDKLRFNSDNFQCAFLALITNTRTTDFKLKYGLYANTENYGLLFVPILGIYYLSENDKLEANLNLPILADINYRLSSRFWTGVKFDGLGTTYNLSQNNYTEAKDYVVKTTNEISGYLRYKLFDSVYLNAKVGYAIGRSYDVYDGNYTVDFAITNIYFGDHRNRLNTRFKDGALFKVELLYRLHFKD
ncbi:DUF6268 family outer membrane beta-barrel protein [Formosa sp. S-31]|uniref:DUF6268 family outer membrane beta-barrel protein n=1 Tax=Formosa sp. S-31 TaxID=2790949 RepID=UPI003EBE0F4E